MYPDVVKVRHLQNYELELTFADGEVAVLDFRGSVVGQGGVFQPLEDIEYFRQVRVDPESGTIVWPNDADFCPDVLYHRATGKPLPGARKAAI
jgi:hypothetical protein